MLAVELTKPFLLPEFVELGGDDGGSALVGRSACVRHNSGCLEVPAR